MPDKLRLNLGCGRDYRPGFTNIDVRPDVGADLVYDITSPLPFPDASAAEVVAQDILEHLTAAEQGRVLTEIHRLLIPGGELTVRIPNLDEIISRFAEDPDTRNLFLYGDTRPAGSWGVHKSGHSLHSFTALALKNGLQVKKITPLDTNWELVLTQTSPPRPHSILFINQTLGRGGAETFNTGLLSWLNRHGLKVKAWTTNSSFNRQLSDSGILACRIPLVIDLIGDWKGLIKGLVSFPLGVFYYLRLIFQNRRVDVILLTGYIEKIIVTPLAFLWHLPVVWVEFGPLSSVFAKFFGLPKFFYRAVSRLPDAVIYPSYHSLSANTAISQVSSSRSHVVPCAVVDPGGPKPKPEKHTVCCVSRLESGKGQDLLIQSWVDVIKKFPTAKLTIIGEGAQYLALKLQIKNLRLQSCVTLTGWVPDPRIYLARAQICVFPSLWPLEGFGLVALEAMAMSRPVVGFKYGPLSEIITPKTGILVASGDTCALAQAICSLLANPSLSSRLGQAGRRRFHKFFTFARVGPRYQDLFTQVLAQKFASRIISSL